MNKDDCTSSFPICVSCFSCSSRDLWDNAEQGTGKRACMSVPSLGQKAPSAPVGRKLVRQLCGRPVAAWPSPPLVLICWSAFQHELVRDALLQTIRVTQCLCFNLLTQWIVILDFHLSRGICPGVHSSRDRCHKYLVSLFYSQLS